MTEKEIGKYIKECIESQGKNITMVSIKSKITRQTLHRIINGENYTKRNFNNVCTVLGIDPNKLVITTKTTEDDRQD